MVPSSDGSDDLFGSFVCRDGFDPQSVKPEMVDTVPCKDVIISMTTMSTRPCSAVPSPYPGRAGLPERHERDHPGTAAQAEIAAVRQLDGVLDIGQHGGFVKMPGQFTLYD